MLLNNEWVKNEIKEETKKFMETRTKIRAELNDIESKSTILRNNESRSWFFKKLKKN